MTCVLLLLDFCLFVCFRHHHNGRWEFRWSAFSHNLLAFLWLIVSFCFPHLFHFSFCLRLCTSCLSFLPACSHASGIFSLWRLLCQGLRGCTHLIQMREPLTSEAPPSSQVVLPPHPGNSLCVCSELGHLVHGSSFSSSCLFALLYCILCTSLWRGAWDEDCWDGVQEQLLRFEISQGCAWAGSVFTPVHWKNMWLPDWKLIPSVLGKFLEVCFFFFFSTVLSVFSLKCFLSTCWASWTISLVSFFSYFPSHLLAVLSGRCTQPCLISFCWGFHSCSLVSKISLVLWIFRITSCSYFMVVILSNGICFSCNISFLQVVYFGFSLIIKGFLRYLAGEPWLSAHL